MFKIERYNRYESQYLEDNVKYWTIPCPICNKKALKSNCYVAVDETGSMVNGNSWCCHREECINMTILRLI